MISDKFRGIFFGALSAACYGLNPLFAVPLLRQGIGVASVLFFRFALAFCGVGILCAADGGGNAGGRIDLGGAAVVAVSALTYAVYLVAVNKTRLRGMNGTKLSFYILLFGSVFLWANAEAGGGIDVPATAEAWANVLLLATIPTLVSTVAIVLSLRCVGPTTTAILGAFEPVAAVAAGVLFLGDRFTGALASGIVLIVAAVSVVVLSGKK